MKIKRIDKYPSLEAVFSEVKDSHKAAFLDSSLQNELGRYSIIGMEPYLELIQREKLYVNGEAKEGNILDYIKKILEENHIENDTYLPFLAGGIGYFSYDFGRKLMGVESSIEEDETASLPEAMWSFYDKFLIEDHEKSRLYYVSDIEAGLEVEYDDAYKDTIIEKLATILQKEDSKHSDFPSKAGANFEHEEYKEALSKMINYIVEGDIYIANMTQQLRIKSKMPSYQLFQILRKNNPAPFGGYLMGPGFEMVCASPERFLQLKGKKVQTRPIKGTRPRGNTPEEDEALRIELQESKKDQSELLMIVDLERNDLNRVCKPGSVKVTDLFAIESYATVHHLISNIEGELRDDLNAADLIKATFPGGSITGAPKLRAMEIIDELENSRRNIYTGSLGYIGFDGSMDLNIIIRTALHIGDTYYLGVGGGITCESELEFEYDETIQKAKAILKALGNNDYC